MPEIITLLSSACDRLVTSGNERCGYSNFSDPMKSKVPQVTFLFWLIKICATTLGETGGDAVSMSLKLGYAISTAIFFAFFLVTVIAQIRAKAFHPYLYWTVIVATTTVGTTTSDFLTRTAGLGYPGASIVLFLLVLVCLGVWRWKLGTVSVDHVTEPRSESFYWATILASNTLGTALGDALADNESFGFGGAALVFGGALAVLAVCYFFTKLSHAFLFWAAFILTRPLGATLGDLLTKPHEEGGLELSRFASSAVLFLFIAFAVWFSSRALLAAARAERLSSREAT